MNSRILHLAKLPPPIGGITMHVQRLVSSLLHKENLEIDVLDYSRERNVAVIFKKIFRAKIVHIHLSRQLNRLVFIVFFKLLFKKVVVTFHGRKDFSNKYDYLSLVFSDKVIVLNKETYNKAIEITKHVELIGAFIPPVDAISVSSLRGSTIEEIKIIKNNYKYLFSTNAFKVVFDENNEEIYGGSLMLELFSELKELALVFSDPTGEYKSYLLSKYHTIPQNIHFITYIHDFIDVIKITDCTIRATTTDGDPLSVKESLYYKTNTICSDVIDRPKGAIVYKNKIHLKEILNNYSEYGNEFLNYSHEDNVKNILNVYLSFSHE